MLHVTNRYAVGRVLYRGSMPLVEATDTVLQRPVVLRTLSPGLALEPGRRARFLEAAALVARIRSPHIAQILDMGEFNGSPYVVMELPAGQPLRSLLDAGARPSLEGCIDIGSQLCAALASAQSHGLVQLGLRPDSTFVTPEGHVTIVPFGSIAVHGTGGTLASLTFDDVAYLAPEIVTGLPPDQRAELFTLGVMLYEMLTGRRPFSGTSIPRLLVALVHERPDFSLLPQDGRSGGLAALVARALAPELESRYQDAQALQLDLETLACDAATPVPVALWTDTAADTVRVGVVPGAPARPEARPLSAQAQALETLRAEALDHAVAGRLEEARARLEVLERQSPGEARNEELRAYLRGEEAALNGAALLDAGQHQLSLGNLLTARAAALAALALPACRARAQELLKDVERRQALRPVPARVAPGAPGVTPPSAGLRPVQDSRSPQAGDNVRLKQQVAGLLRRIGS